MEKRTKNSHLLRSTICPLFSLLLIHLVLPRCDCIHLTKFCRSESIACDFLFPSFSLPLSLSLSHDLYYHLFIIRCAIILKQFSFRRMCFFIFPLPHAPIFNSKPRFDVSILFASVHRYNNIIFDSMHRKITKYTYTVIWLLLFRYFRLRLIIHTFHSNVYNHVKCMLALPFFWM